jgi:hypothetical protein
LPQYITHFSSSSLVNSLTATPAHKPSPKGCMWKQPKPSPRLEFTFLGQYPAHSSLFRGSLMPSISFNNVSTTLRGTSKSTGSFWATDMPAPSASVTSRPSGRLLPHIPFQSAPRPLDRDDLLGDFRAHIGVGVSIRAPATRPERPVLNPCQRQSVRVSIRAPATRPERQDGRTTRLDNDRVSIRAPATRPERPSVKNVG